MAYIEITQPNTVTDGSSGNDTIYGTTGWDVINGLAGNDRILGNADGDTIFAGAGNDTIFGNEGSDALIGEQGNDIISGGSENDLLQGGLGGDTLTGGSGADTFDMIHAEAKTGSYTTGMLWWRRTHHYTYFDDVDVIKDFNAAEGDMVRIYEFDMSGNAGDFSTGVSNGDTHLMFKGATFAVLEGVTNFNLNNDLDINPG